MLRLSARSRELERYQHLTPELRALTVNLIATELFRGKRARKERESGTPTGIVRGRRASEKFGERQHAGTNEMLAGSTGLEPAASGVTGRRSNQLNYDPKQVRFVVGGTGLEPVTPGV